MKVSYGVDFDTDCKTDEFGNPDDWSSFRESYTNRTFLGIRKGGADVASELDLPVGSTAYVVWVEYSTGDSFSCDTRGMSEVLGIFSDKDVATAFKKFIEQDYKEKPNTYKRIKYQSTDGQEIEFYSGSWKGYFESLDDVWVSEAVISS